MEQLLKVYGLTKDEIKEKIKDVFDLFSDDVKIKIKEKYLDSTIDISSKNEDTIKAATREIMTRLGGHVYADGYQTLYEKLAELLIYRNKKLCLFEQGSGSIISSNLAAIDGADAHIAESINVPSVSSWLTKFDIDPRLLSENNGISSKLAFVIASCLRRTCVADYYVVSISSDAAGMEVYNAPDRQKETLSLVAIGNASGVEIYKQILTGEKRDKINQTAKSITFKLISELKK